MTSSKALTVSFVIAAVLQDPVRGTKYPINTTHPPNKPTAASDYYHGGGNGTANGLPEYLLTLIPILAFVIMALLFGVPVCIYCFCCKEGAKNGGSGRSTADGEYRSYNRRSRGSSGGSGGGGHSRTAKKHRRRSRSTGHSKSKPTGLTLIGGAVPAAAAAKPKSGPPKAKPSHTPHTVKPRPATAGGGGGGHHQPTVTMAAPTPAHSTVVGNGGNAAGRHNTVIFPPPRSPKPKAKMAAAAKPSVSLHPNRSSKPRSKPKTKMKLRVVSKVAPRSPKPRPKSNSGGGGNAAGADTQETLVTSKCRPSVFFEQIREKMAAKEQNQKKK